MRQLLERLERPALAGPLDAQLVDHRIAVGLTDERGAGEDLAERRLQVVEEDVLADPTGCAGLDGGRQHAVMSLGGEHHDLGTGREEWTDQIDATPDDLAEADVEQHALRLEPGGVLDDVGRRRPVGRFDRPSPRRQRQLEADGDEGVILDDEHRVRSCRHRAEQRNRVQPLV